MILHSRQTTLPLPLFAFLLSPRGPANMAPPAAWQTRTRCRARPTSRRRQSAAMQRPTISRLTSCAPTTLTSSVCPTSPGSTRAARARVTSRRVTSSSPTGMQRLQKRRRKLLLRLLMVMMVMMVRQQLLQRAPASMRRLSSPTSRQRPRRRRLARLDLFFVVRDLNFSFSSLVLPSPHSPPS